MQVTKIKVCMSMTIPLPEYSNVKPGIELEAVLEPGDTEDEAYQVLQDKAKVLLLRTAGELLNIIEPMKVDADEYISNFFHLAKG